MKINDKVKAYFAAKVKETEEKAREELINSIVKAILIERTTEDKITLMKDVITKFSSELDKIEEDSLANLRAISEW